MPFSHLIIKDEKTPDLKPNFTKFRLVMNKEADHSIKSSYFDKHETEQLVYQRDSGLGSSISSSYPVTPPLSSSSYSAPLSTSSTTSSSGYTSSGVSHLDLPLLSLYQNHNHREETDDHKEGIEKKARKSVRTAFQNNKKLIKEYQVNLLLGWGGNGSVLGATQLKDGKSVAIKIIYKRESEKGTVAASKYKDLPNEIKILRQLSDPNIVEFIEWFEDCKAYYLVTERVSSHWDENTGCVSKEVDDSSREEDECMVIKLPSAPYFIRIAIRSGISDLFSFIDCQTVVPQRFRSGIFSKIASGISYMHSRGFIHGDIKEENILLSDCYNPKICDFGHSKRRSSSTASPSMAFYGTKDMTPPELLPNLKKKRNSSSLERNNGFESDVWALGLLLYSICTGTLGDDHRDFLRSKVVVKGVEVPGESYPGIDEIADPSCVDLLRNMLRCNPQERFTIDQVLEHPWVAKSLKKSAGRDANFNKNSSAYRMKRKLTS